MIQKSDKLVIRLQNVMRIYKVGVERIHALDGINLELGENDLAGWIFHEKELSEADFSRSNLTGAEFRNATLVDADLGGGLDDVHNVLRGSVVVPGVRFVPRCVDFDGCDLASPPAGAHRRPLR